MALYLTPIVSAYNLSFNGSDIYVPVSAVASGGYFETSEYKGFASSGETSGHTNSTLHDIWIGFLGGGNVPFRFDVVALIETYGEKMIAITKAWIMKATVENITTEHDFERGITYMHNLSDWINITGMNVTGVDNWTYKNNSRILEWDIFNIDNGKQYNVTANWSGKLINMQSFASGISPYVILFLAIMFGMITFVTFQSQKHEK